MRRLLLPLLVLPWLAMGLPSYASLKADPLDESLCAHTHDPAGNVLTRTDARGITATFTHDALNRVTGITYPNPGENVALSYDTCTGGAGRLCGVSDATGARAYAHDANGNVLTPANARCCRPS